MKIKVYCKAVADLTAKVGAYAFLFVAPGESMGQSKIFRSKIKTLTHADCAAYVNALHYFASTKAAECVTSLEIVTDSGKVVELLDVYKAEKHCEDVARYWREQIKPILSNVEIQITKIKAKDASIPDGVMLRKCEFNAKKEMTAQKYLLT